MINDEILNSPYFTLSQLNLFTKNKQNSLVYISRRLKKWLIIKIRNWIYISSKKVSELSFSWKTSIYIEFISTNLIYSPSYLSMEYVLFENNILTENVYSFTLVSTNKTAKFKNYFWDFNYKSIKKDYFSNYEILKKWDFTIYKASVEKALFDYFYFKRGIVWEIDYFLELRLNLENLDFVKFIKLVEKYNNKKIFRVLQYLKLIKNR